MSLLPTKVTFEVHVALLIVGLLCCKPLPGNSDESLAANWAVITCLLVREFVLTSLHADSIAIRLSSFTDALLLTDILNSSFKMFEKMLTVPREVFGGSKAVNRNSSAVTRVSYV